jgi:hypothetical protein
MIVAAPAAIPCTVPFASTLATAVASEDHETETLCDVPSL